MYKIIFFFKENVMVTLHCVKMKLTNYYRPVNTYLTPSCIFIFNSYLDLVWITLVNCYVNRNSYQ